MGCHHEFMKHMRARRFVLTPTARFPEDIVEGNMHHRWEILMQIDFKMSVNIERCEGFRMMALV